MVLMIAACGSAESATTVPTTALPAAPATGLPATATTAPGSAVAGSAVVASEATAAPFNEGGLHGSVGALVTTTTLPPELNVGFRADALYVALYGRPGTSKLGVLGEQSVEATVQRAQQVAATYAEFGRPVIPTFEIITTVASFEAGDDGDYSNEPPPSDYQEWVDAARINGLHVIIDLQSGRASFPEQAAQYESLLVQPHVSLAIDPEWRVGPGERPGNGKIGTVTAAEVNATVDYLDALIRRQGLPSKMLVVHQFRPSMISDRQLVRGTDKVQVVIQMDGFGSLDLKHQTYSVTMTDLPPGVLPGWKDFYDEDSPTPTPAETMANVPTPIYVSYQ